MEKHRLLVMNGQCIAQSLGTDSKWHDGKIEKAGTRPPGLYNLFAAVPADAGKPHDGLIVHADAKSVYQQVGKSMVKHAADSFDKVPDIGAIKSIAYSEGKAVVAPSQGRVRARAI
jgi:hypothetical protein